MGRVSRAASGLFVALGSLLLLVAVLAALASLRSLVERLRFGPGLLFADVELFAVVALVSGAFGVLMFWIGIRVGRRDPAG